MTHDDEHGESLVDWHEPERNAHVLDWRERAHEFGLVPVDDHGDTDGLVVEPPERLIEEEEPEAFDEQHLDEQHLGEDEEEAREDSDESPEAGVSREDLDLVRVYLKHIGRRKLLKAAQEQEIGRRIEVARGELIAELASIPAARATLNALADAVKRGEAPAAELILLPDGGELRPENVDPVMRAFARVRRLQQSIDRARRRLDDRRLGAATRAKIRAQIDALCERIGTTLRDQPIRPSVVDDVVAELRELDHQIEAAERM